MLDLIALPAQGRFAETRWRKRICSSDELTWAEGQADPALAGLKLWAAKEAAFKCASSIGWWRSPRFQAKRWEIICEETQFRWRCPSGRGFGQGQWRWGPNQGYLLALAVQRASQWPRLCYRVRRQAGLTSAQRSWAVRQLLTELVATQVARPGETWQVGQNPNGAPLVRMDHSSQPLGAALSHDGPWLGAALRLDAYDSSP